MTRKNLTDLGQKRRPTQHAAIVFKIRNPTRQAKLTKGSPNPKGTRRPSNYQLLFNSPNPIHSSSETPA